MLLRLVKYVMLCSELNVFVSPGHQGYSDEHVHAVISNRI